MALLRTDYVSINRGGAPATAGGVTGTYYVVPTSDIEKMIGVPRLSALGTTPVSPGPHAFLDDSVNPAKLMVWNQLGNAYIEKGAAASGISALTYTAATRLLRLTDTLAVNYDVTLPAATTSEHGVVQLATGAEFVASATNDTDATTPAYVAAALAALVAASPAALDTLNELAAAIGNDTNFATTVTTALGARALTVRTITGGGLVTGGGDLTADRVLTVTEATTAESTAGALGTVVITPRRLEDKIRQSPSTLR